MAPGVESLVLIVDFVGMHPRNVDFRVPKLVLETLQVTFFLFLSLVSLLLSLSLSFR